MAKRNEEEQCGDAGFSSPEPKNSLASYVLFPGQVSIELRLGDREKTMRSRELILSRLENLQIYIQAYVGSCVRGTMD